MQNVGKLIRNNRGLIGQILSITMMITSLVGVGIAINQNAKYRKIASVKVESAKSATHQLDLLLNMLPTAAELGASAGGTTHCSVSGDTAPACAASPIKWTVTTVPNSANRLLKIEVSSKLANGAGPQYVTELGEQSITGYKYNDF